MSRLLVGIFPLNENKISLQQLVYQTLKRLEFAPNLSMLTTSVQDNMPLLFIDAALVSQALATVIFNGLLRAKERVNLSIEQRLSKNEIKIVISDDGPLLPSEYQSRLFERFLPQVDSSPRGLGYHVAKGIIRAHEGRINASIQETNGLSIEILLPITE